MASATPDSYDDALRREILRSELQRMRALAIILAILLAFTLVAANLFPELNQRLFRGGISGWLPLVGIGPFLLYELAALMALRWRLAKDKDFPRPARVRHVDQHLGCILASKGLEDQIRVRLGTGPGRNVFLGIVANIG